jgi:glutamyl-tRNA synthetase
VTAVTARAYRGRFAPSPTGAVHLGTARTALVAWLRARSVGGAFVLRMEDLDGPRVRVGAAEAILADLRWLGLDWDEGPDVGGPHAPYVQSACTSLYEDALARLRAAGRVYPCTCTRKELAESASAPHGEEPVYPGTCRHGPTHPERPASMRFGFPEGAPFDDVLMGRRDDGVRSGDFVVRRSDGLFAYQLAVVVDDLRMGITEVVRGADLLSSTPRQIALFEALGGTPPAFLHVPLVLGPDGERLAKRHGAIAIAELRAGGASAEQIVGRLAASLGLVEAGQVVSPRALVERFELARLPHTPAPIAP